MTSNISSDVFMLGIVGKGAVESCGTDGKRCNQVNVLDIVFRQLFFNLKNDLFVTFGVQMSSSTYIFLSGFVLL